MTMRVPLPFQVIRAEPPKVLVKDGYLIVEWHWGKRTNPLVESERPDYKVDWRWQKHLEL